jgi:hypothetical protein
LGDLELREPYPRIRIVAENGLLVAREGLSFTFFMKATHSQVAPAVQLALESYLRAIGPGMLSGYLDQEGEYQPLDDAGWAVTRRNLLETSGGITWLRSPPENGAPYRFDYYGKDLENPARQGTQDATCAMTCWLPTEFLESHGPDRVRQLALEMATPLPFCSGYAGLSFNGELDLAGVEQRIAPYCFRYPGIDIPDVESLGWRLGTRFRNPAWLTFIGRPLLDELGGSTGVRSRLQYPGTTVHPLGAGRALVTLGQWPEAGDTENGEALPAYRELAHLLQPWLFHEPRGQMPCLRGEDVRRWERRFLD